MHRNPFHLEGIVSGVAQTFGTEGAMTDLAWMDQAGLPKRSLVACKAPNLSSPEMRARRASCPTDIAQSTIGLGSTVYILRAESVSMQPRGNTAV